jgi:hypothetical protein
MPKIKCIGCGALKIIPSDNITLQVILNNGYNYVWDMSDGLTNKILCNKCAEEIREHVHAIEEIIGIDIGLLHLGDYSKFKIK